MNTPEPTERGVGSNPLTLLKDNKGQISVYGILVLLLSGSYFGGPEITQHIGQIARNQTGMNTIAIAALDKRFALRYLKDEIEDLKEKRDNRRLQLQDDPDNQLLKEIIDDLDRRIVEKQNLYDCIYEDKEHCE